MNGILLCLFIHSTVVHIYIISNLGAIMNEVTLDILIQVFGEQMYKSLLNVYLGMNLFGYKVYIYLTLTDIARVFQNVGVN